MKKTTARTLLAVAITAAIAAGVVTVRGGEHQLPPLARAATAGATLPGMPTPYQLEAGAGITITSTTAQPPVSLQAAEETAQQATGETPISAALYQCQKAIDTPPLDTTCWVIGMPVPAAIALGGGAGTQRPQDSTATFSTALVDANTGNLIVTITGTQPATAPTTTPTTR